MFWLICSNHKSNPRWKMQTNTDHVKYFFWALRYGYRSFRLSLQPEDFLKK